MQNLLRDLTELLSKDDRLVSEGKLLKNKVIELALKMDSDLIKLLLGSKPIKKYFFADVDGVLVFDKIKFQKFVSNKEFLPDSYTAFKNKIGLVNENGNYLSESKEVVLAWPYKDCFLEGGQTKEDQKRDEIFWNETLAPDEIDRLLAPKVFTNFRRYDTHGEHQLTGKEEIDFSKENLIVKGNNLLALHSLYKRFAGKVKLIYIDPPFNTGSDTFTYNDRFSQSTWLTFMKNRLEVARDLLDKDGNIFVHIDDNQCFELKVLMDEIEVFKKENFVETVIWAYGSPSGGRAAGAKLVGIHDYILHYAKSYTERKQFKVYTPYTDKYLKDWFKYKDKDGRIYQRRMRGRDEKGNVIWEKQYLDQSPGVPGCTVWPDIKQIYADPRAFKAEQRKYTEMTDYDTQKPEALLKRIIEYATSEGDLVLDFFNGSGTTTAVAHKMKRQWIGVEQLEEGAEIFIKRMKNILNGDQTGISKSVGWKGGGEFIYCELMKYNEAYIHRIRKAKTAADLIAIWKNMQEKAFISYRVEPKAINENTSDFEKLTIDEKKRLLIEILDKNQLYVNYSEMDDAEYRISETDKKLNRKFYEEG